MVANTPTVPLTQEDFEAFIALPENEGKAFELVAGEIEEKMASNLIASRIAARILFFIELYLYNNKLKGHVTGADGGYMIGTERYIPDVAYLSFERQPALSKQGYNPIAPELAVEVISDVENKRELTTLRRKIAHYVQAGVTVWVVNPYEQYVEVFRPSHPFQLVEVGGVLSGEDFLEGFTLAVADLFPADEPNSES